MRLLAAGPVLAGFFLAALLLVGPTPAHPYPAAGATFPAMEVAAAADHCAPGAAHPGGGCVVAPGCVAAHASCCALLAEPFQPSVMMGPALPWRLEPALAVSLTLTPPLPPPIARPVR